MAVLTGDLYLYSVAAQLTDLAPTPWNVRSTWRANVLATGALKEVTVDYLLTTPAELVQADWDSIFADAATAMATAAGGSASAVNPVTI